MLNEAKHPYWIDLTLSASADITLPCKARDVALQQGAVAFNAQLKTFLTEANIVFILALTHQLLEQPSVLGQAVPLLFQYQCFFSVFLTSKLSML